MIPIKFDQGVSGNADQIAQLFDAVFSDSEGAEEGTLISDLVRALMDTTPEPDLYCFCASDGDALVGGIFFSRLRYAEDIRRVFLMAPVAVAAGHQGQGVGQALIRHGLDQLRADGVDVVVTYGDPAFYGRVGFKPATIDEVPAPKPLSQPHGWIAQTLSGQPLSALKGPANSVAAFDKPELW